MSLDVYLTTTEPKLKEVSSGIFIRENGQTREITRNEWDEKFPNTEPVVFIQNEQLTNDVYSANITHNLNKMAVAAGIYDVLWIPNEIGMTKAGELIELLEIGLNDLKNRPEYFEQFNSSNGWGTYEDFVPFVENYLNACKQYPDALISVSR